VSVVVELEGRGEDTRGAKVPRGKLDSRRKVTSHQRIKKDSKLDESNQQVLTSCYRATVDLPKLKTFFRPS
jgi:hypothetical protein